MNSFKYIKPLILINEQTQTQLIGYLYNNLL